MSSIKKLSVKKIIFVSFLAYFFSYAMRLDYAASIVSMVADLKITNTQASFAVTGSFITYGFGQIICGFIGDKISPPKMVSVAMLGTVIANLLISFQSNIYIICALWCFNGIFQAMLWPPITRFLAEQIPTEKYANSVTAVGLSASTATIFIYATVPVILRFTVWRNVFRIMSVFGVAVLLVWTIMTRGVESASAAKVQKAKSEHKIIPMIMTAGLIPIFIAIALQGILRDGIQTWLPTYMNEVHNLDTSNSVLSTVGLPVLSMLSVIFSTFIFNRIKSELKTAAIFFATGLVATLPLCLFGNLPFLVAVVLSSLISGCMHGVNNMLICMIPKRFARYGMVSTFSGLLNSCTYIGAAISSYGFAKVADSFGWNIVLIGWFAVALIGTAICVLKIKSWNDFIKDDE